MNPTRLLVMLLLCGSLSVTVYSHPATQPTPTPTPSPTPAQRSESFWSWVFRVTGISATPRNQREDHQPKPGHIWVANLQNGVRQRVPTDDGGYSSPVFFNDGLSILALQGVNLVKVPIDSGVKQVVGEVKGAIKLIGFAGDDPDRVLLLRDEDQDACPSVGVLSLTDGSFTAVPYSKQGDDQDLLSNLEAWTRTYDAGDLELKSKRQNSSSGFDVFLKQKNKDAVNVSKCQTVNCCQGSLSKDRTRVVFIKED